MWTIQFKARCRGHNVSFRGILRKALDVTWQPRLCMVRAPYVLSCAAFLWLPYSPRSVRPVVNTTDAN